MHFTFRSVIHFELISYQVSLWAGWMSGSSQTRLFYPFSIELTFHLGQKSVGLVGVGCFWAVFCPVISASVSVLVPRCLTYCGSYTLVRCQALPFSTRSLILGEEYRLLWAIIFSSTSFEVYISNLSQILYSLR